MTVEFINSQSPQLQEHLFEIWIRLRRDPTGSSYRSSDVADAMLMEALAAPRRSESPTLCAVPAESPRWYRRYRVNAAIVPKARKRVRQKATRPDPVSAVLDYIIPTREKVIGGDLAHAGR